jgi:hypothetical protein
LDIACDDALQQSNTSDDSDSNWTGQMSSETNLFPKHASQIRPFFDTNWTKPVRQEAGVKSIGVNTSLQ